MAKSAIWIIAVGVAIAATLTVAYMPNLFFPPQEEVPQLQTAGKVRNTLAVGEEGSFRALATGGKTPYQFEWIFPDGTTVHRMNATHSFESPGKYEVMVSITDDAGQSNSHTFEIQVTPAQ